MRYLDWVYFVYGLIAFGCLLYGLYRASLVENEDQRIWEEKRHIKNQKERLENEEERLRAREKDVKEKLEMIKIESRKLDKKKNEFVIYD